jgi:hypothetical protein
LPAIPILKTRFSITGKTLNEKSLRILLCSAVIEVPRKYPEYFNVSILVYVFILPTERKIELLRAEAETDRKSINMFKA